MAARDLAHERITDVRDLEPGDRVLVGDREKPLTVRDSGTRPQPLVDGTPEQHAVECRGTWTDARAVLLANELHVRGERTGRISVDLGPTAPVWRVQR